MPAHRAQEYERGGRATPYRSRSRHRPPARSELGARPWPCRRPPSMLPAMIESQGLTKRLGGRVVVDDVTFRCEPGTVTGFLGPNGAGKTTTMRMLVSLLDPDAGSAAVLGGSYRDLPNPARRVGILLDASAQHGGRRGREALGVSAPGMGG